MRKRKLLLTKRIIISLVFVILFLGSHIKEIAAESEPTTVIITPINAAFPLLPVFTVITNSVNIEQNSYGIVIAGSNGVALILRVSAAD